MWLNVIKANLRLYCWPVVSHMVDVRAGLSVCAAAPCTVVNSPVFDSNLFCMFLTARLCV